MTIRTSIIRKRSPTMLWQLSYETFLPRSSSFVIFCSKTFMFNVILKLIWLLPVWFFFLQSFWKIYWKDHDIPIRSYLCSASLKKSWIIHNKSNLTKDSYNVLFLIDSDTFSMIVPHTAPIKSNVPMIELSLTTKVGTFWSNRLSKVKTTKWYITEEYIFNVWHIYM